MAGSWNHTMERDLENGGGKSDGKLLSNVDLVGMLENGGDVYEYAEEAYGMVWWLATELAAAKADRYGMGLSAGEYIERARQNYQIGLERSPGIAEEGELEDAEEEDPREWEPEQGQWVMAEGPGRPRLAKVIKRVQLSFDTYRIYLWDHDKLRLGSTLTTYHVRFLRPATTADLDRYRVPEEER